MKKYKVCVYAICKNEEAFVSRFMNSMKEADEIYVLDTGSTDKTVDKLKQEGAIVKREVINPWRFDVARNKSLDMVPEDADICVCVDLDEVFESGWRETLEKIWEDDTTRLAYNYNWSLDKQGKPAVNFYIEKIHNRHDYKWTHPVHEILTYIGNKEEVKKYTNDITVNHYPDQTKSRAQYLPLLELSVQEDPEDDRNMHYLGREYMYQGRWNDAISTLINHLKLPKATWKDERAASMRFIARSYKYLNRYDEAHMWLDKAIKEAPYLREAYVEKALLCYLEEKHAEIITLLLKALEIKEHPKTYINEPFCYDETIYDLLSLSYYALGNIDESLKYVMIGLEINPHNKRMQKNKEIIAQKKP